MSKTVVVGLKHPNGLILTAVVGGKEVSHTLNGWSKTLIHTRENIAFTTDVPEDLWAAWLADNKESKLVKGGYIFAQTKEKEAKAQAKEVKGKKSGHEGLDQLAVSDKVGGLGVADE